MQVGEKFCSEQWAIARTAVTFWLSKALLAAQIFSIFPQLSLKARIMHLHVVAWPARLLERSEKVLVTTLQQIKIWVMYQRIVGHVHLAVCLAHGLQSSWTTLGRKLTMKNNDGSLATICL